jgi:hypothetical protein
VCGFENDGADAVDDAGDGAALFGGSAEDFFECLRGVAVADFEWLLDAFGDGLEAFGVASDEEQLLILSGEASGEVTADGA